MSILIPSTEPGVLEDIGSLLTYNPVVEAYEDCERAMEHDGEVWREVWPDKLYLYNQGDECAGVTGGWGFPGIYYKPTGNWYDQVGPNDSTERKKEADKIFLSINASYYLSTQASVHTKNKINTEGYSKICVLADISCTTEDGIRFLMHGNSVLPDNIGIYTNIVFTRPFKRIVTSAGAPGFSRTDVTYTFNIDPMPSCYIAMLVMYYVESNSTARNDASFIIKKVWLER